MRKIILVFTQSFTNMYNNMEATKEKTKYPANLYLKEAIKNSGQTVKHVAKTIGFSRKIVSDTIHGHYKGANIVPLLRKHLNLK